jgi:hypothetical protein
VRFVYSPMSFKLGIYVTFLAMMTLALLLLYWLWGTLLPAREHRGRRTYGRQEFGGADDAQSGQQGD